MTQIDIPSPAAGSAGLSIGLLGGSFDPPHHGHRHLSLWALRALGLRRVWWLVSPGNPLKPVRPAALERRMEAARALARDRRILVSDFEARIGRRHTVETLAALRRRFPRARFVWLMGADNLATLHRWRRWRRILETTPTAVFARPGSQVAAGLSPAARAFARARLPAAAARSLVDREPPCWTLLTGPTHPASSTRERAEGRWAR